MRYGAVPRRVAAVALGVGISLAILFQFPYVKGLALLLPSLSGFVESGPDLWVERGPASSLEEIRHAADAARSRVARFYGGTEGHPVVLACRTVECFRRHGGIGHGTTYFGRRVLLGPTAWNEVKVAHEFSHVEVAARVGPLRTLLQVPRWFDEGLAVLASEDPNLDDAHGFLARGGGAGVPSLDQLETLRGWLAATRSNLPAYATAREGVARFYSRVGLDGLRRLFAAVRAGEEFHHAYARMLANSSS